MQSPIDPQQLLAHSGWMRGLAMQLLGDAHRADDAVQDALVAAMESRPGHPRNLKSWLGGVLRNQARMTGRGESRRRTREAAVARPEASDGVSESVETFALQRAVVDAVLGLDSPNREIVVLRYFEELPTREVAQRLQLTTSAVRSRLSRSLESLRSSLDAHHGGQRSRWAPALAAWAGNTAPQAAKLGAATWAAASAVVLLAGVLWILQPQSPNEPEASPAQLATLQPGELQRLEPLPRRQPRAGSGGPEPRLALAPEPSLPSFQAAKEAETFTVHARTIDALGQPLAGVRAELANAAKDLWSASGADGAVSLTAPWPPSPSSHSASIQFIGSGRAIRREALNIESPGSHNLGDVVLDPGGAVTGRVLGADGAPLAGQAVFAGYTHEADARDARTRRIGGGMTRGQSNVLSAADGTYTIEGLPVGASIIQACLPGALFHFTPPFLVSPGETAVAEDLVLAEAAPNERWRGRVESAEGEPVFSARVALHASDGMRLGGSVFTDEDGRFSMVAPTCEGAWWNVWHPDRGQIRIDQAEPGVDKVLSYGAQRWIEIEAQAKGLDALLEATARLARPDSMGMPRWATAVEGNRLRLALPEGEFELVVDAVGYRPTRLGPYTPSTAPALVTAWLKPAQVITGSVLDPTGAPAQGVVHLHEVLAPDAHQLLRCGLPCGVKPRTTTYGKLDGEGQFCIEIAGPGNYELHVTCGSDHPALIQRLKVPGTAAASIGVLQLEELGSIQGVLQGEAYSTQGAVLASAGDGHLLQVIPAVDGSFAFHDLRPGTWHLTVGSRRRSATGPDLARLGQDTETYSVVVQVQSGRTSACSLDGDRASRSGIPRSLDGLIDLGPGTSNIQRVLGRGQSDIVGAAVDPTGAFALRIPEESISLELQGEVASSVRLSLWTRIDLPFTRNRWTYAPATGSVELVGLPRSSHAETPPDFHNLPIRIARVRKSGDDEMGCTIKIAAGSLDSIVIESLPVGTYSVGEGRFGPAPRLEQAPGELRFEVLAGSRTTVPVDGE